MDKTEDRSEKPENGGAAAGAEAVARAYLDLWEAHLSLIARKGLADRRT